MATFGFACHNYMRWHLGTKIVETAYKKKKRGLEDQDLLVVKGINSSDCEHYCDGAFEFCTSLQDVVFVDGSLRSIEQNAFLFPAGHVGDWAFYDNSGLISVEIPQDSTTTFGERVFARCPT